MYLLNYVDPKPNMPANIPGIEKDNTAMPNEAAAHMRACLACPNLFSSPCAVKKRKADTKRSIKKRTKNICHIKDNMVVVMALKSTMPPTGVFGQTIPCATKAGNKSSPIKEIKTMDFLFIFYFGKMKNFNKDGKTQSTPLKTNLILQIFLTELTP